LFLFLEHRDLRGEFGRIDRGEVTITPEHETVSSEPFQGTKAPDRSLACQLAQWAIRFRKVFQVSS
jgi:hypothetical protein